LSQFATIRLDCDLWTIEPQIIIKRLKYYSKQLKY